VSIDSFGLDGAFFGAEDDEELPPAPSRLLDELDELDELEELLPSLLLPLDATVDGNFKGWRTRFVKF
jgi:hypothetical protein